MPIGVDIRGLGVLCTCTLYMYTFVHVRMALHVCTCICTLNLLSDIDECTDTPGICGGTSTCNNQPDGGFYTCTCGAGATLNMGQASMGTLTCEGALYMYIICMQYHACTCTHVIHVCYLHMLYIYSYVAGYCSQWAGNYNFVCM